jgi:hypothetical protein
LITAGVTRPPTLCAHDRLAKFHAEDGTRLDAGIDAREHIRLLERNERDVRHALLLLGDSELGVALQVAVLRARRDRRSALYALLIRTSVNASLAWWISVAGVFGLRACALYRDWTIATVSPTRQS